MTYHSEKTVLLLANNASHINYLSSYIEKNECKSIALEVTKDDIDNEGIVKEIQAISKQHACIGIIVSSEIDDYRVNRLPAFFSNLRKMSNNIPIVFFHPSRVHAEDRKRIVESAKEPFKALQGHDLETDSETDLDKIIKGFLI